MRNSYLIISILMLSNFSIKLMAENPANMELNQRGFDYDLQVTNGEGNIHLAVYANKRNGAHYEIKSFNDKGFLNEFQALIDDEADILQNIWCDQFLDKIPDNFSPELNDRGNKVFTFNSLLDNSAEDEMAAGDFVVNIEVSAENDQVLSYHMKNNKTFSPAFATKVQSYEYKATCFPLQADRNALKEFTIAVKGKAYFYAYNELIKRVYSNHQPSK